MINIKSSCVLSDEQIPHSKDACPDLYFLHFPEAKEALVQQASWIGPSGLLGLGSANKNLNLMTVFWCKKSQSTVQTVNHKPLSCKFPIIPPCVGVIRGLAVLFPSSCFVISSSVKHLYYSTLGSWPRWHNVSGFNWGAPTCRRFRKGITKRLNLMLWSLAALWPLLRGICFNVIKVCFNSINLTWNHSERLKYTTNIGQILWQWYF